jgi:hypothetical protein
MGEAGLWAFLPETEEVERWPPELLCPGGREVAGVGMLARIFLGQKDLRSCPKE